MMIDNSHSSDTSPLGAGMFIATCVQVELDSSMELILKIEIV
jgi:hypothetical protein